jgi:hypothetical protein
MNHITRCILASGLLCAASFTLSAQQPGPPKVLRIYREDIKEGKGSAHEKVETRWAQTMARLKYPANSLALTSMSGTSQAWFLEGHETFASIGEAEAFFNKPAYRADIDALDAQDAELRASSRQWIAVFRNDLSYRTGEMMGGIAKARYFNVVIFRIHQGRDQEFADVAKTAVAASQKAGNDQAVAVRQVVCICFSNPALPSRRWMTLPRGAKPCTVRWELRVPSGLTSWPARRFPARTQFCSPSIRK